MNKQLIFGSTAMIYWFPDFNNKPKDLDIIFNTSVKAPKGIEYHWVDSFQYIFDNNIDCEYVDKDFLYTIKISHAAWDIWWDKTMYHINFMKERGCKLDYTLYNMLIKEWEILHGSKKRIKLKGKPETFFNTNVTRKIDHEQLHEIVKFYDKPIHYSIRKDINTVTPSKKLWDSLSYGDQIKCALEETYVFALERYIDLPPNIAFTKALKHLITHSTKGYFNLFLIDNFFTLIYFDKSRYLKFYKQIKEGNKNE